MASYRDIEVPELLVDDLRMYLGDLPELNRLIEGTELSDEKIRLAVRLFIGHFNNSPPPLETKYGADNFPDPMLMFHGTGIELLKMAGIVQSRNFLNFNDGGVPVTVSDKAQDYLSWINNFFQTYIQDFQNTKVSLNAEEGFGYIDSPEAWFPDFI